MLLPDALNPVFLPLLKGYQERNTAVGSAGRNGSEQERWLAEPGTGNEPELRPGCVNPVFESRVSNPGPERTMAESALWATLGIAVGIATTT